MRFDQLFLPVVAAIILVVLVVAAVVERVSAHRANKRSIQAQRNITKIGDPFDRDH